MTPSSAGKVAGARTGAVSASARRLPDLHALPPVLDLPTAARYWGIGERRSYELAKTGELPFPVVRVRGSWRVTRAALLRSLGIDQPGTQGRHPTPGG